MAGRGPSPQPTGLRTLRGNPGHRKVNGQEAKIPPGELPVPTDELDEEGLKAWHRTVPILQQAGLATPADRDGLTAYCQLWSQWVHIQRTLQKHGQIVIRKGIPHLHPLAKQAEGMLPQLRLYLAEFGMTPAARSRIKVDVPPPKTRVDLFREKHGG